MTKHQNPVLPFITFQMFMFFLINYAFSLLLIAPTLSFKTNIDLADPTSGTVIGPLDTLHILNRHIAPDGYNRSATIVNHAFPAPLLKGNKGDEFSINVMNTLTDEMMPLETSIHFHGIFQIMSNWADGVPYVTQCPLRQYESFVYRFNATGQAGTYWYHSHYKNQYCDGLRGPLVIYDPDDPLAHLYDYDNETTIITLADWYHNTSLELGKYFPAPTENSTLINGKGRYASGPPTPLSVINVEHGFRYRLRLVSMACNPTYNFSIDGHTMTIIEADGNEVFPVTVDSIPIFPGQRYSVVITADQPVGNYWIRSLSDAPNATFDGGQNSAILRYGGASFEDPKSYPGPYELSFDESQLHPLVNPRAPGNTIIGQADVNQVFAVGNTSDMFTMNNVSYVDAPMPVLLQILSGKRKAWELLPKGSVYTVPLNKVVEISFPYPDNATDGPHPMHLHGHHFSVVRVAGSTETNFVNPVRRDVVSIGSGTDNVIIRFRTDNPGPWILHCHIDWHFNHGFAVVMAVAPNETAIEESNVIPQDWFKLCLPGENWGQTRSTLPGI